MRGLASVALIVVCAGLVGGPLLALAVMVGEGEPAAVMIALTRAQLPTLALSVFSMGAGAVAWALVAAVPLAWLVERTDMPFRRAIVWLAPLPLAVPPYVAAIAYAQLLGRAGTLHTWLATAQGVPPSRLAWPIFIYGNGGAAFILGLFTAPSLFLIVRAALTRASPTLEEASRGLGFGPWRTFLRVTLPLIFPAIAGGAILVFVYAAVDFGVVSLLRARTVTTTLYTYLLSGYSRPASAAIALGLVSVIWVCLAFQSLALRRVTPAGQGQRAHFGARVLSLGAWRWVALVYAAVVLGLGLLVPVAVLVGNAAQLGADLLPSFMLAQLPYLRRSLYVSAAGASFALLLSLIVALARVYLRVARPAGTLLQAGYALPGTVLGIALVALLLRVVPDLYGTAGALIIAYVVMFSAPAFQASRSALVQVTPSLEAAARGLGSSPVEVLRRVTLPLAAPGLVGGWALCFALAFRELAATIVIRPPGYDTLAVRIWAHTMDVGPDPRASAVALLMLVVAAGVWIVAWRFGNRQ